MDLARFWTQAGDTVWYSYMFDVDYFFYIFFFYGYPNEVEEKKSTLGKNGENQNLILT